MQYKGFKQMKRLAAVILSAAIVLTDVPGVAAAENAQAAQTQAVEEAAQDSVSEAADLSQDTKSDGQETQQQTQDASGVQASPVESGAGEEASEAQEQTTEAAVPEEPRTEKTETENTEIQNTEEPKTEKTETESTEIKSTEDIEGLEPESTQTQTTEQEPTEELTTEASETQEETETEVQEAEPTQVPVPDIDDSVYEPEHTDYTAVNNAAPIASYNAGGTLTPNEQGEYVIGNRDQFLMFLSSTTNYSGSKVLLNCDVDMRGETAQLAKSFEGTFDGNGHSIFNYQSSGGLFRQIGTDGSVKKLHLSGITFADNTSAAALASTNNGFVSDITVTADIKVKKSMTAAAGIVLVNAGTISGCAFSGAITAESGLDNAEKAIGGITAENEGVIQNCHTLGSINTNTSVMGGIAAKNSRTIEDSTNHMSVSGAYYTGGIAGKNTGTVTNCKNYGAVSQKNNADEGLAGGIAASSTGSITDCENYAQVSGEYKSIGGIAGNSTQTISGCGNYGAVTGSENVGGIVGLFSGSGATIKNSFNKGKISAKTNKNSGEQGIGGILGAASQNAACVIQGCYNTGAVSSASDTRYIGGIAGMLYKGSIKNTYNAGEVSASAIRDDFNPYAAMLAGFMGKDTEATYTDCLFTGGSDTVCNRESGVVLATGEKLSAEALKGQEALSTLGGGFALDDGAINGGYPVISGQKAKEEAYIILYEPNGGCADYYFTRTQDDVAKPSATPTRKSASFKGWYRDKALKEEYRFGSVTKSEVVYAGWELREEVEDICLDQTDVTLILNESFDIKPQVLFTPKNAENKELVFSSDDSSVATVDENGIVRAVGVGTARITIGLADKSIDKELTFTVNVSNAQNIVRFKLYDDASAAEITRTTISVGEPVIIQAVFGADTPANATLQWSTSNPACVKKTERTDLIRINAVELEGLKPTTDSNKVEITCILKYPDGTTFTGVLRVTVRPLAESVSISLGRDDATGKDVVYDIDTKQFIAIGTNKLSTPVEELSASILPKAADQRVKWSSSDTSVIKFDDEESGKAVGNKSGEATVTAMPAVLYGKGADGKEVKGTIRVKTRRIIQSLSFTPKPSDKNGAISYDQYGRIEITDGMSINLEPTYVPADATIKKVNWSNSNKNALDITVTEGTNVATVKAKKVAANTIVKLTAEATDMGEASCELEFIVKPKVEKVNIYRKSDIHHDNCLSGGSVGVEASETFDLIAVNEPENSSQRVTWKISNTKIADLTENADGSCTIKVKDKGTAQITATTVDGTNIKATTTLNVTTMAKEIKVEGSSMVMVGGKITLTASVYPKSASNCKVKWVTSTPEYAKVDEKTGVVTGVATGTGTTAGTAIIKAVAQDGSGIESPPHIVTVYEAPKEFDLMIPDGDKNEKNDKLLTGKTIGIDPDLNTETYTSTYTVAPRILPEKACQKVEWKSSNEKVATVKEGVITAHTFGKATITAKAIDGSNRTASVTVNVATLVKGIEITGSHYIGISDNEDIELQLKAVVKDKDASNKSVVWKSEYPSIAEVDETGLVIANAKSGSTKITAEAADGSGVIAEHTVYVASSKNKVTISRADSGIGEWVVDKKDNRTIEGIDLADRETVTIRLRADLSGGSPERDGIPMELKWSTSNKNIATVEADESDSHMCTVTLYNKGVSGKKSVKITATTTEGYESSASVTIKDIKNTNPWVTITGPGHQLANGKKMQLSAGDIAVTWHSDSPSVAVVDEKKGVVKADKYATGTARITAVPVVGKGSPNWDTYEIHVAPPTQRVEITLNGVRREPKEKLGIDIIKGYEGVEKLKLGALLDSVASEDVTWKSSNQSIAALDEDGYLDVKKTGTVTFTATASDGSNKKEKITFVITKQTTKMWPAGGRENVVVGRKKSVQLNVEYRPLGTTMKKAQWESSDTSIAKVNKNNGKVTGVQEGTAVITATATDGSGKSCTFNVQVVPAVSKVDIVKVEANGRRNEPRAVVGVDLGPGVSTYTTKLSTDLYVKEGKEYIPLDAQRVEWSSSNKAIAEVDEDGLVTVHKAGEVTIKATATDGSKKSGKIKLYAGRLVERLDVDKSVLGGIDLYLGMKEYKTFDLSDKIDVYPLIASNKTLVYTSTNKKCVTVNAKGKVTAKKPNDEPVYIIVTTKDGSGVSVEIPVDVTK